MRRCSRRQVSFDRMTRKTVPSGMDLTLHIPDDLAARLDPAADLPRRALEALAVEEYRQGRLSRAELRRLLGFATRAEVDGFLKARGINESMTLAEFEHDRQDLDRVGL